MKVNEKVLAALSPEEQAQARDDLAKLEEAYRLNPLLGYHPHTRQIPFHISRSPITLMLGGNRAGKTTSLILDALIQMLDKGDVPEHLHKFKRFEPPTFGRIITPDFTRTAEGVIFQKIRDWVPRSALEGGSWLKAYDKVSRVLRFRNGSWMDFLSFEQDLDKFGGTALHWVGIDEEPVGPKGEAIYRETQMRLIDYDGEMRFALTPLNGLTWLHDKFVAEPGEEMAPGVFFAENSTVIFADMDDNPHLSTKAKNRILADLPASERKARKSGHFMHFAGLIYPEFDPQRHVIGRVDPKGDVVVAIDPGVRTTAVVFGVFEDKHLTIFDELAAHDTDAIPENVAHAIHRKLSEWGVHPRFWVIDPAARAREKVNAEQLDSAYHRAGCPVQPGQNAVIPGIMEMKRRMESDQIQVTENCLELLTEISRYRVDPKANDFQPLKRDDHFVDATRYMAMLRPVVVRSKLSRLDAHPDRWQPGQAPEWKDSQQPAHPFGRMF